jgi:hypothetical protein
MPSTEPRRSRLPPVALAILAALIVLGAAFAFGGCEIGR